MNPQLSKILINKFCVLSAIRNRQKLDKYHSILPVSSLKNL